MTCWRRGVPVILEKICDNNFVNNLRAICLFKADFNLWQKLDFARRMIAHTGGNDLFHVKTLQRKIATVIMLSCMRKTFSCYKQKVIHHPASLGESDFGDCYDRTDHRPMSIVLQLWGIPIHMVQNLLIAFKTMKFCLRTGFGESSESYRGTSADPNSDRNQTSRCAQVAH